MSYRNQVFRYNDEHCQVFGHSNEDSSTTYEVRAIAGVPVTDKPTTWDIRFTAGLIRAHLGPGPRGGNVRYFEAVSFTGREASYRSLGEAVTEILVDVEASAS